MQLHHSKAEGIPYITRQLAQSLAANEYLLALQWAEILLSLELRSRLGQPILALPVELPIRVLTVSVLRVADLYRSISRLVKRNK